MPSSPQNQLQAIVIGGGVSGLACAYYLRKLGISTVVLEKSERSGGIISSSAEDGFVLDAGPQSFLSTDTLLDLIQDVGLDDQIVRADARAPRFVRVNGELRRVAMNPAQLLTSALLGWSTKFALLRDAAGHTTPPEPDESVADFVRRKFTPELLERLVGPFISGIFAGDPERLSLRAAFPTAYQAEREFGSIVRGTAKMRQKNGRRHGLISFRKGTAVLTEGLARSLASNLLRGVAAQSVSYQPTLLNSTATEFARGNSSTARHFSVQATQAGREVTFTAASLIVTTPADAAAHLLTGLSPDFATPFAAIEYVPVAVISSIYRTSQIARPLEGFGFLVPCSEGLRLLGTIWNSSLFAGRAPHGYAVLTSFAGGATDPDLVTHDSQDLAALTTQELAQVLPITGRPERCAVTLYARALPQYNLGHVQRIASLRALCCRFEGLGLAGNYLDGPSIGACVDQARRVALATRDYLSSRNAATPIVSTLGNQ